jgi:hypothetical protein
MTRAQKWSVALLALAGCVAWGFYLRGTRHFCNGYTLQWMNGAEAVIADESNLVVTRGTVARYATNCPFITGYTSKEGFPPETYPVEGYFLIDTQAGSSRLGMTEAEWKQELASIRWRSPSMHETHPSLSAYDNRNSE